MPPQAGPTPPPQINNIIPAARSYVHFTDIPESGHNDHEIIGWALLDDNQTVVPLIVSTADTSTVVQASVISPSYTILNPYSECAICVRPEV